MGLGHRGQLNVALGDYQTGKAQLQTALTAMNAHQQNIFGAPIRTSLAEALAASGDFDGALVALTEAKTLAEETGGEFHLPEMLRLMGAVLLAKPNGDQMEAERFLLRSLDLSRRQELPGWELRSAITLARLQIKQGEREKARTLLVDVCKQFSDGWQTGDLSEARALIESLKP